MSKKIKTKTLVDNKLSRWVGLDAKGEQALRFDFYGEDVVLHTLKLTLATLTDMADFWASLELTFADDAKLLAAVCAARDMYNVQAQLKSV